MEDLNGKKDQILANNLSNFHDEYTIVGRIGERVAATVRIGEQSKNGFSVFHNHDSIGKKIREINSVLKSFLDLQFSWAFPSSLSLGKVVGFNERHKSTLRELASRGWFLSDSMNIGTIREILQLLGDANVSGAEALVESHLEESLDKIEKSLINRFGQYDAQIKEAFQLHIEKHFNGSVGLFIILSEGIGRNILKVSPLSRKDKNLDKLRIWLAEHSEDKDIFTWYWSLILEPLPINASKLDGFVAPLNRHEVIHGFSINHGTHRDSLKALSWLTYVASFALC